MTRPTARHRRYYQYYRQTVTGEALAQHQAAALQVLHMVLRMERLTGKPLAELI